MQKVTSLLFVTLLFGVTFGSLDPATVSQILSIHNSARQNVYPPAATPIPSLTWSTILEAGATALATSCTWNHSALYYYAVIGETISWSTTDDLPTQIQGWVDVGQALYDITTNTCYSDQYWPYCDRYTQMIWAKTTYVGCAINTCPGTTSSNFVVCQYLTPGNYPGVLPYSVNPSYLPSAAGTSAATYAPTSAAPTSRAPTSAAPTSAAATTHAPTSAAATTRAPTSAAATTRAPTSAAATTRTPATSAAPSSTTGGTKINATGSFDWRYAGGVTPVKNQGACGCCWAFSAIGAVESAYKIKYGVDIDLSEQELVDCVTSSIGCNGGVISDALTYGETNGFMLETNDPYKAAYSGSCTLNTNELAAAKVTKLIDVQNNQAALLSAMRTYGPVSIAVGMADQAVWQSYLRGTIQCPSDADIDHAVLAIGWSQEGNYFIGKNQWGTSWGLNGFFYLDATQNCGLFTYTTNTVTVA